MQGGRRATGAHGLVFDIQGCLGRGGFGEVYLATMETPTGVRAEVALKALRSDLDPGSDAVKRLRDEGRMLGALRHPSILQVHDLVLLDHRVALVTEYVEGRDLSRLIHEDGGLPVRPLLSVIAEVASALDAAFRAPSPDTAGALGLVHRDVKPANIRIGRHGEVKLLDFGVARASAMEREANTLTNMALGSLAYMAPERFQSDEVHPPSDVWSLGCTLYEALAGRRLFPRADFRTVMMTMARPERLSAHLREALDALPDDLDHPVRELVGRMLDPQPDARPTAAEVCPLCEDLADVLDGPTLRRWCRDHRWAEPDPVDGASLRPGRLEAATWDEWEIRLASGEPPRQDTTLEHVIRDRPPPVRAPPPPSARETQPTSPRRDEPPPPSEAKTLPPQRLLPPGPNRLDPDARFGIEDLSDVEFERALAARDRRARVRRVALAAVLVVAVAGAGAVWAWPAQARQIVQDAWVELERWASPDTTAVP